jgi:hypothetical protein
MAYQNVVISSGHGKTRGAAGLDEVDQARAVVEAVAQNLRACGTEVKTFHDDTDLAVAGPETIADFHNAQSRQLDISVHFNAYVETTNRWGARSLPDTKHAGNEMSAAISVAGGSSTVDRKSAPTCFLNETVGPAILLEICFVDSQADEDLYRENFEAICEAIAAALKHDERQAPGPRSPPILSGKASWFGGPEDEGVTPDEGLAFIYEVEDAPHLFLPYQPEGTSGLARRLNPSSLYRPAL